MGWLEFTVIIVCSLLGFIVMNAAIDARRAKAGGQQRDDDAKKANSGAERDDDAAQTRSDRQHRTDDKESPRVRGGKH